MFSLEVPLEKSLSTSASGCRQNSFPCSRVTKSSYFLLVLGWRWPIGPCHMGFSREQLKIQQPASSEQETKRARVSKLEVIDFCNMVLEMTSHLLCHVPFIGTK